IVKRHVAEIGTPRIMAITDPHVGNQIYVSRIAGAEVVSALARRTRGSGIQPADAARGISDFHFDFTNQYQVIEVTKPLIEHAMLLAEKHALRGYDAVQLASVALFNAEQVSAGRPACILVSSDSELNAAAVLEGLKVENPNQG